MSLPVTRPAGQALVVGSPASLGQAVSVLRGLGYTCVEADDPYAGMAALSRRPAAYTAFILSLHGIYREELPLIEAVKRRYPHVEVWLTDTDGRQGAFAEAMRLGAAGLLSEEGLHRIGVANFIATPIGLTAIEAPAKVAARSQSDGASEAKVSPASPNRSETPAPSTQSSPGARPSRRRQWSSNVTDDEVSGVFFPSPSPSTSQPSESAQPAASSHSGREESHDYDSDVSSIGEPVLTPAELRALLEEEAGRPSASPETHHH